MFSPVFGFGAERKEKLRRPAGREKYAAADCNTQYFPIFAIFSVDEQTQTCYYK